MPYLNVAAIGGLHRGDQERHTVIVRDYGDDVVLAQPIDGHDSGLLGLLHLLAEHRT